MADEPKTGTGTETLKPEEKTFTQSQLDAIIKDRLDRERKNYADYDEVKKKAETLEAESKKRKEAEMSETEKLKHQIEEINKEFDKVVSERDSYKTFKTEWETRETGKIEEAAKELSDRQKEIIAQLPLSERMAAINEFASVKPGSGDWGKKAALPGEISVNELHSIRVKYGANSKEYRSALTKYKESK